MSYWKTKVVPKFKKFFDKGKKKGASEACKSFDSSKEALEKEIGEKTPDLHPKIIEIYRSSTIITKKLLKEPNEPAVKENPDEALSILSELAKAGFPGAQVLSDAGIKFGPALLPGPIVYLFQKTSTFLVEEPLPETKKEETREIQVGEIITEEKPKEPEPSNIEAPPPPVVEEGGVSGEEKKEVIPIEAKKEEVIPIEVKKEEVACIKEAKKEETVPVVEVKPVEVAPIEAKKEVVPIEAKKEVAPVVEAKKEVSPVEEKKPEVCATKEDKKDVAAPSQKEEPKGVEEKKEKPSETAPPQKC